MKGLAKEVPSALLWTRTILTYRGEKVEILNVIYQKIYFRKQNYKQGFSVVPKLSREEDTFTKIRLGVLLRI